MNNKLFEKLGITPGPWVSGESLSGNKGVVVGGNMLCTAPPEWIVKERNANIQLIATSPELLEALIKSQIHDEAVFGGNDYDYQIIIEKATGKTWQEIKAIMEAEND